MWKERLPSVLTWLIYGAMAVVILWQGVALRQARQEVEQLRQRQWEADEAAERLRQGRREADERVREFLESRGRPQGPPPAKGPAKEPGKE